MRCDDVRARFDDLRSGTPPAGERSRLRKHLASCGGCRAEWEFMEILARDLAALRSLPSPDLDVTERVMRGIAAGRARSPWPWAIAAAAALLVALTAVGWQFAPTWAANAARVTARLAASSADNAPTWLASGEALLEGTRRAARALLPDSASLGSAQPFLLFFAQLLIGAVVAASMALLNRVTRAARRPTGDGS